ncbi:alpha-glucoside permease [Paramyrothecium foliicola]|nr:alpha-glucoside permease [Paramyrothecium foliicola]
MTATEMATLKKDGPNVELVDDRNQLELARDANAEDHNLTIREALKKYPMAVFWSVAVSGAVIMEGYDIILISSLYAQSAFQQKYGRWYPHIQQYQLPAEWQVGLGQATAVGTIIGAVANGYFTEKFGYRKFLLANLVAMTGFLFVMFFAPNVEVLLIGKILCGLPWGVFATMAPAYASEVCPMALRGHLAMYVNMCWAIGQLIATGVMSGTATMESQWAYRIPLALQWAWPVPLFAVLWFMPESPWWYTRRGRLEEAEATLRQLTSNNTTVDFKAKIAMMLHTEEIEKANETGTRYVDCFKNDNLRRTTIGCLTFCAQVLCGLPLGGTPTYFFTQAGVAKAEAFKFSTGGLGLAAIGTMASWFLVRKFGRRTLFVTGLTISATLLMIVGTLGATVSLRTGGYGVASMVLLWLVSYSCTIGPVTYAIVTEVSAIQLRAKSVSLARIAYYISSLVSGIIEPYFINPTQLNWGAKTGFFWAGTCTLVLIWAFLCLPETKNRTYEELDTLFAKKTSARRFASTKLDVYADTEKKSEV